MSVSNVNASSNVSLGVRKRVDSNADDSISPGLHKRSRLSSIVRGLRYGRSISIGEGEDRMIRTLYKTDEGGMAFSSPRRLSASSSLATLSQALNPLLITDLHGSPPASIATHGLIRSVSLSSIRSSSPLPQQYPEVSAKHHLSASKVSIDYVKPPDTISTRLLSCSKENVLFFTRGNRVYLKSINNGTNEEVTQLFRLSESGGHLRVIECGKKSLAGVVAIGTSKGYVQTWDVTTRKLLMTWPTTKDVSALAWNGSVLTVGGAKGIIHLYDTRASPTEKMREQARKTTRHQGQIMCLTWNDDGRFLASGDSSGVVHCWEYGQMVPMHVGEFVQRRKKIHHDGKVSALGWSSWSSKVLASGDDKGIVRLWNINPNDSSSNAANPGKLDTGASVTGIHFSEQCMEILTTHGDAIGSNEKMANSVSVHTASLRHVTTLKSPSNKPIGDSVLNSTRMKVIFTVPYEGKINVYDAWAKRKELRREGSRIRDASLYIR